MEEKLLSLLIKNPQRGLEKMMDTYTGLVYTIVNQKLSGTCSKEDIEECVSTIFYEAYEKREKIDLSKGSIKSYLATLSKRRAIDTFRKNLNGRENVISIQEIHNEAPEVEDVSTDVFDQCSKLETRNMLVKSIKDLGEPDNEIFIRKYYFGQSTKIIAQLLDIKENTVDKRVSRGLSKLRAMLNEDVELRERMDGRNGRKNNQ